MSNKDHIISNLSDSDLKQILEEIQSSHISDDALVVEVVKKYYGEIDILMLQAQYLIWPLLKEISTRYFSLNEKSIELSK